jgi:hypothetical protein
MGDAQRAHIAHVAETVSIIGDVLSLVAIVVGIGLILWGVYALLRGR